MTERARTVFLGSGQFGVESLRVLSSHPMVSLTAVVTAPPRPAGRNGRLTETPIDAAARDLDVPLILRPARLRAAEAIDAVTRLEPALAVLADYGQLVPRPLLELENGALNLHPSLLPRHRGASPIAAAILAGDSETGVTLMQMDEGLDTGPIVAQQVLPLDGGETGAQLEERCAVLAAQLLERALEPWLRGEIEPRPQPGEQATLTRPLRREDGRLDPAKPAALLERQVRAYQPWPGSFFETPYGRLVVWRVAVLADEHGVPPGELVSVAGARDRVGLATAHGTLEIIEAQPAGGRRMPAAELLRGRPQLIGARAG